jgi:hypothetical protein
MRILVSLLVVLFLWFGSLFAGEPSSIGVFEVLPKTDVDDKLGKHFDAYGYRYTGGHYENELIPFRLYAPQKLTQEKKLPLFVFFHGRGNYGNNYHQLRCLRYVDYDGTFFLLAASCNDKHPYWGTIETNFNKRIECPTHVTQEIIENLCKTFPIDRNEIHLIGYSDGTNAVSYMIDNGLRPKSAVYIGNEPPKESSVYFDDESAKKWVEKCVGLDAE